MARSYHAVLNSARRRHLSIADEVFRTSRANFYDYMATRPHDTGRFSAALCCLSQLI